MQTVLSEYKELTKRYLRPQLTKILILLMIVLIGSGLQLLVPQIVRYFIDLATSGIFQDSLLTTAILFIAVAVASQMVNILANYIAQNLAWSATNELRSDIAAHCLNMDMTFHNSRTPGEMIERVDGDVSVLANFFSQFYVQILNNLVFIVGVLVILYFENWSVGILFTFFITATLFVVNKVRNIGVPFWGESRQASANLYGFIEERLGGIEDVKSSGATSFVMKRFYELLRVKLLRDRKAYTVGVSVWASTVGFFTIGTALALGVGAYFYQKGQMTIGSVYLLYSYVQMLRMPIEQISRQFQDFQKASASIKRTVELLRTKSLIQDGKGISFPEGPLSIEFNNVHYSYKDGEKVLEDISFHLEPGKVMGLLGRSGSGKTTIMRLLYRFYDPSAGSVKIGNTDIRDVRLKELRNVVGLVTQDVQLFKGTIRDNVAIFDSQITDEVIIQAFKELELESWFRQLPDGLDTKIGPGGEGLSAGESQLLALTRMFIRNPKILIFDEVSSRLDPVTEKLVTKVCEKLLKGRTGIIISHRLAILEIVENILILENGEILEFGDKEDLQGDPNSTFYKLIATEREGVLQ
ncbi:ABC transporter ATP-binding protein [Brevibacillus agri]|uniref:ABC transporter ATP-binding protein n=1 Tax=Brevibacillus agri TaxID=51101 RepID=UPI000471F28F|nr:ABC transporter ATP-binding protein [Brevibacillus agri]MED4573228.1 ABC transporter ATP-binding protein [Brevibacillus agri]